MSMSVKRALEPSNTNSAERPQKRQKCDPETKKVAKVAKENLERMSDDPKPKEKTFNDYFKLYKENKLNDFHKVAELLLQNPSIIKEYDPKAIFEFIVKIACLEKDPKKIYALLELAISLKINDHYQKEFIIAIQNLCKLDPNIQKPLAKVLMPFFLSLNDQKLEEQFFNFLNLPELVFYLQFYVGRHYYLNKDILKAFEYYGPCFTYAYNHNEFDQYLAYLYDIIVNEIHVVSSTSVASNVQKIQAVREWFKSGFIYETFLFLGLHYLRSDSNSSQWLGYIPKKEAITSEKKIEKAVEWFKFCIKFFPKNKSRQEAQEYLCGLLLMQGRMDECEMLLPSLDKNSLIAVELKLVLMLEKGKKGDFVELNDLFYNHVKGLFQFTSGELFDLTLVFYKNFYLEKKLTNTEAILNHQENNSNYLKLVVHLHQALFYAEKGQWKQVKEIIELAMKVDDKGMTGEVFAKCYLLKIYRECLLKLDFVQESEDPGIKPRHDKRELLSYFGSTPYYDWRYDLEDKCRQSEQMLFYYQMQYKIWKPLRFI